MTVATKQKHVPLRTCIVTREKAPKSELMRIVDLDGRIVLDTTGKARGRGANMKKNVETFELALTKGHLERAFKRKVAQDEKEALKVEVLKYLEREALKDSSGKVSVRVKGDKVKLN